MSKILCNIQYLPEVWENNGTQSVRWVFFFANTHLSVRSPLCRLKSREGTILSMCWGSQMLACNSSFTVFLTTPCRPLIPAMRILEAAITDTDSRNHLIDSINGWVYLGNHIFVYICQCLATIFSKAIFNCSKMLHVLFSVDDKDGILRISLCLRGHEKDVHMQW